MSPTYRGTVAHWSLKESKYIVKCFTLVLFHFCFQCNKSKMHLLWKNGWPKKVKIPLRGNGSGCDKFGDFLWLGILLITVSGMKLKYSCEHWMRTSKKWDDQQPIYNCHLRRDSADSYLNCSFLYIMGDGTNEVLRYTELFSIYKYSISELPQPPQWDSLILKRQMECLHSLGTFQILSSITSNSKLNKLKVN